MISFPLPFFDPEAVPGNTTQSDKAICGYVNVTLAAVNELEARLRALESASGDPTLPTLVVSITMQQAQALLQAVVGQRILFVAQDDTSTVTIDAVRQG